MGEIEEIYADLDADITEEEFREAVAEKVEQMGGLADEETAAILIAHELTDSQIGGIADIEPGMEEVQFLGKVVSVGELREFEREGEDEPGHVVNLEIADETGSIRAAFWDEMAQAAVNELDRGTVLRLQGRPREGYQGVEVSVDRAEPDPDADVNVAATGASTVEDLAVGRSDVTLRGRVLDVDESVRTFERDDGSEGRVANMVLGDETGRVRLTLWDERTDLIEEFTPGESVEVVNGYVRERDGDLELHVGSRGTIEPVDGEVAYVPDATDIADVELDQVVDLVGVVRSADPARTFDRDDGSEGKVRNLRVQDKTGDIRVALWGEHADVEVTPGDKIHLADVEIREGWQDDLEASAGWRSTVTVLDDEEMDIPDVDVDVDAGTAAGTGTGGGRGDAPDLSSFGGDQAADRERPEAEADAGEEPNDGPVEFTGVVVQAGDPVILDDGEETMRVDTDADVELGEEVTVRGTVSGGRMDADEVHTGPS